MQKGPGGKGLKTVAAEGPCSRGAGAGYFLGPCPLALVKTWMTEGRGP